MCCKPKDAEQTVTARYEECIFFCKVSIAPLFEEHADRKTAQLFTQYANKQTEDLLGHDFRDNINVQTFVSQGCE